MLSFLASLFHADEAGEIGESPTEKKKITEHSSKPPSLSSSNTSNNSNNNINPNDNVEKGKLTRRKNKKNTKKNTSTKQVKQGKSKGKAVTVIPPPPPSIPPPPLPSKTSSEKTHRIALALAPTSSTLGCTTLDTSCDGQEHYNHNRLLGTESVELVHLNKSVIITPDKSTCSSSDEHQLQSQIQSQLRSEDKENNYLKTKDNSNKDKDMSLSLSYITAVQAYDNDHDYGDGDLNTTIMTQTQTQTQTRTTTQTTTQTQQTITRRSSNDLLYPDLQKQPAPTTPPDKITTRTTTHDLLSMPICTPDGLKPRRSIHELRARLGIKKRLLMGNGNNGRDRDRGEDMHINMQNVNMHALSTAKKTNVSVSFANHPHSVILEYGDENENENASNENNEHTEKSNSISNDTNRGIAGMVNSGVDSTTTSEASSMSVSTGTATTGTGTDDDGTSKGKEEATSPRLNIGKAKTAVGLLLAQKHNNKKPDGHDDLEERRGSGHGMRYYSGEQEITYTSTTYSKSQSQSESQSQSQSQSQSEVESQSQSQVESREMETTGEPSNSHVRSMDTTAVTDGNNANGSYRIGILPPSNKDKSTNIDVKRGMGMGMGMGMGAAFNRIRKKNHTHNHHNAGTFTSAVNPYAALHDSPSPGPGPGPGPQRFKRDKEELPPMPISLPLRVETAAATVASTESNDNQARFKFKFNHHQINDDDDDDDDTEQVQEDCQSTMSQDWYNEWYQYERYKEQEDQAMMRMGHENGHGHDNGHGGHYDHMYNDQNQHEQMHVNGNGNMNGNVNLNDVSNDLSCNSRQALFEKRDRECDRDSPEQFNKKSGNGGGGGYDFSPLNDDEEDNGNEAEVLENYNHIQHLRGNNPNHNSEGGGRGGDRGVAPIHDPFDVKEKDTNISCISDISQNTTNPHICMGDRQRYMYMSMSRLGLDSSALSGGVPSPVQPQQSQQRLSRSQRQMQREQRFAPSSGFGYNHDANQQYAAVPGTSSARNTMLHQQQEQVQQQVHIPVNILESSALSGPSPLHKKKREPNYDLLRQYMPPTINTASLPPNVDHDHHDDHDSDPIPSELRIGSKLEHKRLQKEQLILQALRRLRDNLSLVHDVDMMNVGEDDDGGGEEMGSGGNGGPLMKTPMNKEGILTGYSVSTRSRIVGTLQQALLHNPYSGHMLQNGNCHDGIDIDDEINREEEESEFSNAIYFIASLVNTAALNGDGSNYDLNLGRWKPKDWVRNALRSDLDRASFDPADMEISTLSGSRSGRGSAAASHVDSLGNSTISTKESSPRRLGYDDGIGEEEGDDSALSHTIIITTTLLQKMSIAVEAYMKSFSDDEHVLPHSSSKVAAVAGAGAGPKEEMMKIYTQLLSIPRQNMTKLIDAFTFSLRPSSRTSNVGAITGIAAGAGTGTRPIAMKRKPSLEISNFVRQWKHNDEIPIPGSSMEGTLALTLGMTQDLNDERRQMMNMNSAEEESDDITVSTMDSGPSFLKAEADELRADDDDNCRAHARARTRHEHVHNECNIHLVERIEEEEERNKSFSLPLDESNEVENKNVSTTIVTE